jgi:hypothetical protein
MNGCYIWREYILELSALNGRDVCQVLLERTNKGDRCFTIGDIIYAAEKGTQAFSNSRRHQEERVSKR